MTERIDQRQLAVTYDQSFLLLDTVLSKRIKQALKRQHFFVRHIKTIVSETLVFLA